MEKCKFKLLTITTFFVIRKKTKCFLYNWIAQNTKGIEFLLKKNKENNIYRNNLELLWECCQIPDFEKKAYGQHINIIETVFKFLSIKKKKIPNEYMKIQLSGLEKQHGNIDVLANRISNVRTWSYVANKKNWVENGDYWIIFSAAIEDNLSDTSLRTYKKFY